MLNIMAKPPKVAKNLRLKASMNVVQETDLLGFFTNSLLESMTMPIVKSTALDLSWVTDRSLMLKSASPC